MSTDDKMTIDERWKYLRRMQKRYLKADCTGRSQLLGEMEAVTGQHRKSLFGRMGSDLERRHRQRQRSRVYGPEVDDALRVIHESWDYIRGRLSNLEPPNRSGPRTRQQIVRARHQSNRRVAPRNKLERSGHLR